MTQEAFREEIAELLWNLADELVDPRHVPSEGDDWETLLIEEERDRYRLAADAVLARFDVRERVAVSDSQETPTL